MRLGLKRGELSKTRGSTAYLPPLRSGPKPFPTRTLSQGPLQSRGQLVPSNRAAAHVAAAAGEPTEDGALTLLSRFQRLSRRSAHPHRGGETCHAVCRVSAT